MLRFGEWLTKKSFLASVGFIIFCLVSEVNVYSAAQLALQVLPLEVVNQLWCWGAGLGMGLTAVIFFIYDPLPSE